MSFDWSSIIHEISIKTNDSYWYTVSGKNISWSVIPQVNCEAQRKGRAKVQPRKVTKRSFIDYGL